jgi:hypothetical protein
MQGMSASFPHFLFLLGLLGLLPRQNPFSRWMGFDQLGFGACPQIEETDPGGVGYFLQVFLPLGCVRESGTTRGRPGAALASGKDKLWSRWET